MITATPLILQAMRSPASAIGLSLPQWDLLIRQARRANLLARLWRLFVQHGLIEKVPHPPRQHLEWARVTAERHAQAVDAEVARIQTALAGFPLILLKGAAYAMADLPPAAGRIFSDIDIMVPKDLLPEVESQLMAHGWMATHHDAYDQRYYRQWMHELPPLQHLRRGSVIDVHHAIVPQTMGVFPDPAKLQAAAVAVPAHPGLQVLSPVDMVLHSAAHLFYEGELFQGLRDLVDLDALLRHFSGQAGFWDALVARAEELELTRVLYYALRYTVRMLETPVPVQAMRAADAGRPGRSVRYLMDALYARALLPDHRSCRLPYTGMARKCLYIRGNWLRMPPFMLARHLLHKAFLSPKE